MTSGEQFLHEQNKALHMAEEVGRVVGYLGSNGQEISQKPKDKIGAYLGFLADKALVNDGFLTGDKDSLERQAEALVIQPEDIPESYFAQQIKLSEQRGQRVKDSQGLRKKLSNIICADQKASLVTWGKYLNSEEDGVGYPLWFKKYATDGLKNLAQFTVTVQEHGAERLSLPARDKSTIAPFPELNPEALATVYGWITNFRLENKKHQSGAISQALQNGSFRSLYLKAFELTRSQNHETGSSKSGRWIKYSQIRHSDTEKDIQQRVQAITRSLQGFGTTWCTAVEATAEVQLRGGATSTFSTVMIVKARRAFPVLQYEWKRAGWQRFEALPQSRI